MAGSGIIMTSVIGYVVLLAIIIAAIAAWLVSIDMVVTRAKARGCGDGKGKLWFIGLFAGPVLLALYALTFDGGRQENPALGDGAKSNRE